MQAGKIACLSLLREISGQEGMTEKVTDLYLYQFRRPRGSVLQDLDVLVDVPFLTAFCL